MFQSDIYIYIYIYIYRSNKTDMTPREVLIEIEDFYKKYAWKLLDLDRSHHSVRVLKLEITKIENAIIR